ncbi:MAG: hypothetical protein LBS55_00215 [Prevotellaceae bacterium]|jgi:hypothetical protein|nr:hypothetical protein [Prevotellaceae bacterium]
MYLLKKYLKSLFNKYTSVCWNIGFIDFNNPEEILQKDELNIRWMQHKYKDRWFADPFILRISEQEIVLLVEEFYYPIKRGRIAKLTIDRKSLMLKTSDIVLELDTHLSFPVIFRNEDDIYIYPESSVVGNLVLYKYDERENIVKQISTLNNEPLTDAIITTSFDKSYLFSTKLPTQNKDILNIYSAKSWNSPYELDHTVYFNDNTARNAGELFQIDSKWIRPAQDCNTDYGKGLVFQEVKFVNSRIFIYRIKTVLSSFKKMEHRNAHIQHF